MENNNFTTPAPEDIPIRDPEVVAAPEKAEETAAPGKTEVVAAKKPPLKFILIGAAALAVVIAVVVILLSRNSPSSVGAMCRPSTPMTRPPRPCGLLTSMPSGSPNTTAARRNSLKP